MRAPLVVQSVVRRAGSSLAIVVAGVLAMGGAAAAPLLTRTTEQASVHDAVRDASRADVALTVSSQPAVLSPASLGASVSGIGSVASPPGISHWYGPTSMSVVTSGQVGFTHDEQGFRAGVGWLADGCARLHVVRGRCPQGAREAAMSDVDAAATRTALGQSVVTGTPGMPTPPGPPAVRLTVVGVYSVPSASIGFGASLGRLLLDPASGAALATRDPLLVDLPVMSAGVAGADAQVIATRDLERDAVGIDDEPGIRAATTAVDRAATAAARGWVSRAPVVDVLAAADAERHVVAVTVPLVGLQLVLIAWVGLGVLVRAVSAARAQEWALGALRGLSPPRVALAALGGTAALLLLAAPVGWWSATLATRVLATGLIGSAAVVEPTRWPVALAVLGALSGALATVVAASWTTVRTPVASLLHRSAGPEPPGRAGLVVEMAVAVLAAAAVYQLLAGGDLDRSDQSGLGLLAPALASVAVGLVLARVGRPALRRATGRRPRRAAALLTSRRLAHAPGALRGAVVLIAGTALAVSTFDVAAVAGRNRHIRAGQEVGAATVLHVDTPAGRDLRDLVVAADPGGREAMAVTEVTGGSGIGRIVAVDSDRYAHIATVDPAWSTVPVADLASLLRPPLAPSIRVTGSTLTLDLTDVGVGPLPPARADGSAPFVLPGVPTVRTTLSRRWTPAPRGRTSPWAS